MVSLLTVLVIVSRLVPKSSKAIIGTEEIARLFTIDHFTMLALRRNL